MNEKVQNKKRKNWNFIYGYLIGVIITILSYYIFAYKDIRTANFDRGYKIGQIDALNGIQHYDKVIKLDTIYFKIK